MKTKNWGGLWFQIRADKGHSDMVTFEYLDEKTGQRINRHFPHRETDGFGALMIHLAKDGLTGFQPPSQNKIYPNPSRLELFKLFWKGLLEYPKPPKMIWKNWRPEIRSEHHDVAWTVFTPEMEAYLLNQSQKLKVNTTTYLLAVLAKICRNELSLSSPDPDLWMMPVNMRGSFPNIPYSQNCVSFVPLKTTGQDISMEAKSLYDQLRNSLKQNQHWAFWELGQIGRWIGYTGMKILSARSDRSYWTGTFSDLGSWENEAYRFHPIANRTWVIAPPGSSNYPLGATSLKWFGQRVLTLKIHPSILPENVSPAIAAQKILDGLNAHFQKDIRKPAEVWKSSESRNSLPVEP